MTWMLQDGGEEGSSGEDKGEMVFQLLFDWYANALQALVDSAGHERAIELLRPYHRNAHVAATFIIKEVLGLRSGDRIAWGFLSVVVLDFMVRAPVMEVSIYEKGSIARASDCPFKHGPVEHCALVCDIGPNTTAEALGIEQSTRLVASLPHGDKECRWITRNGHDENSRNEGNLGIEIANILKWQFPKEMVDSFSIQYFAEWWVIATRSLIDHIGEQQASVILRPYMKHSGISFGLRGSSSSKTDDNSLARMSSLVDQCGHALQMKVTASPSNGAIIERTIIECPFKDAPVQVCRQFEAFCNGVCEAIDSSYEFAYDRMMTEGDKTCHWTIRRRGEPEKEKPKEEVPSDDITKMLAMRFAKGEISLEEFDQSMTLLRKHKVAK